MGEKTSLPLISKLDSDGDSPNCSDDDDDDQGTGQKMDFMMAASGTEDCQATGSGRGSASRKDLIMGTNLIIRGINLYLRRQLRESMLFSIKCMTAI